MTEFFKLMAERIEGEAKNVASRFRSYAKDIPQDKALTALLIRAAEALQAVHEYLERRREDGRPTTATFKFKPHDFALIPTTKQEPPIEPPPVGQSATGKVVGAAGLKVEVLNYTVSDRVLGHSYFELGMQVTPDKSLDVYALYADLSKVEMHSIYIEGVGEKMWSEVLQIFSRKDTIRIMQGRRVTVRGRYLGDVPTIISCTFFGRELARDPYDMNEKTQPTGQSSPTSFIVTFQDPVTWVVPDLWGVWLTNPTQSGSMWCQLGPEGQLSSSRDVATTVMRLLQSEFKDYTYELRPYTDSTDKESGISLDAVKSRLQKNSEYGKVAELREWPAKSTGWHRVYGSVGRTFSCTDINCMIGVGYGNFKDGQLAFVPDTSSFDHELFCEYHAEIRQYPPPPSGIYGKDG